MAGYARNAFSGDWSWQDYALMRSRALDDGKILAQCVPPASDGGMIAP